MPPKSSATISDVAQKAGVSTATVSRMINGLGPISDATETRVRVAIDELNYVPKRKRRSSGKELAVGDLPSSRLNDPIAFLRIGSSFHHSRNPVTETLVEALHRNAHEQGRILNAHTIPDLNSTTAKELLGEAKGVMLRLANENVQLQETLDWLDGLPAVQLLGEKYLGALTIDHIAPDNVHAGALAAEYLLSRGCEKLVFAATSPCKLGLERCISFVRVACLAGVEVTIIAGSIEGMKEHFERQISGWPVKYHIIDDRLEMIRKIASEKHKVFGLFVPTDLELAQMIPQLQLLGMEFEKDAFAVGCDHESRCMTGLDPLPATMDLHIDNIANRGIRRLIHRIEYPDEPLVRISVTPTLVQPHEVMNSTPHPARANTVLLEN